MMRMCDIIDEEERTSRRKAYHFMTSIRSKTAYVSRSPKEGFIRRGRKGEGEQGPRENRVESALLREFAIIDFKQGCVIISNLE